MRRHSQACSPAQHKSEIVRGGQPCRRISSRTGVRPPTVTQASWSCSDTGLLTERARARLTAGLQEANQQDLFPDGLITMSAGSTRRSAAPPVSRWGEAFVGVCVAAAAQSSERASGMQTQSTPQVVCFCFHSLLVVCSAEPHSCAPLRTSCAPLPRVDTHQILRLPHRVPRRRVRHGTAKRPARNARLATY